MVGLLRKHKRAVSVNSIIPITHKALDDSAIRFAKDCIERGFTDGSGIIRLQFTDVVDGSTTDDYLIEMQETNLGWSVGGVLNGVRGYQLNGWFITSHETRIVDIMSRLAHATGDELLAAISSGQN